MKRKVTAIVFLLFIAVYGLTSCRTRELCPAYTVHQHETQKDLDNGV
ncbi:MAG TPA: hypothetical protein VLH37_00110 [Bacteroidales bacterium]|jgi:hypothetical protein|nr:hypothetical protein [Bacteroidales bacterium]